MLITGPIPNSRLEVGGTYCVPRNRDRLLEWVQLGKLQIASPWWSDAMWDDSTVWPASA